MAKTILEEAVEDVQNLKRAAEENAKNLLVEAMSPRIKDFIQSHLGQEGVEGPGPMDGAPAGNNDTAPNFEQGQESDGEGADEDTYEIEDDEQEDGDEDEVEFEPETEEDEDEDSDADADEDSDEDQDGELEEDVESDDDDDSEDDEDMDEGSKTDSVEITSEDLKRAFLSTIQAGLKEDSATGKFGDAQDPNDSEFGLVHKVPGEVMWADGAKVLKKAKNAKMVTKEQHNKVVQKLHRQLALHQEALKYLKKNIHEMNLFNAKLVYTTKLLQNNLSNKQKMQVVEKLDKARSKREVEFMFNTLSESFKIAGVLGEGRTKIKGPKASRLMKPGSTINEGKTQGSAESTRWAELAGLTD